jgi:hypothetical protein
MNIETAGGCGIELIAMNEIPLAVPGPSSMLDPAGAMQDSHANPSVFGSAVI